MFRSSNHPAAFAAVGGVVAASLTPSLDPAGGTLEVVGVWVVLVEFLAGVVGVVLATVAGDEPAVAIAGDAFAAADVEGFSAAVFECVAFVFFPFFFFLLLLSSSLADEEEDEEEEEEDEDDVDRFRFLLSLFCFPPFPPREFLSFSCDKECKLWWISVLVVDVVQ